MQKPEQINEMRNVLVGLSNIASAMKNIPKLGYNDFDQYKYIKAETIKEYLQAALIEHKISLSTEHLSISESIVLSSLGKPQTRVVMQVKFTFKALDESNEYDIVYGEGIDRGDKAVNKANTSAFKNMAINRFCISGDTDAEDDSPDLGNNKPKVLDKPKALPNRAPTNSNLSEAQFKRMFALSKSANWDHNSLKTFLKTIYGIDSSKDLSYKQYQGICTILENKIPFEEAIKHKNAQPTI